MRLTPAEIIRKALLDEGVVVVPATAATLWPIYTSFLPDSDDAPTNAVAIFDTTPVKEGRLMAGPVVERGGFMIHVRGKDYTTGYGRARGIVAALDGMRRREVFVSSSEGYLISSINRIGGVTHIGREPSAAGTKRRELFSINAVFTAYEAVGTISPGGGWGALINNWSTYVNPWSTYT